MPHFQHTQTPSKPTITYTRPILATLRLSLHGFNYVADPYVLYLGVSPCRVGGADRCLDATLSIPRRHWSGILLYVLKMFRRFLRRRQQLLLRQPAVRPVRGRLRLGLALRLPPRLRIEQLRRGENLKEKKMLHAAVSFAYFNIEALSCEQFLQEHTFLEHFGLWSQ